MTTKEIKDIGREMWIDESLSASPLNTPLKFHRLFPSGDGESPTSDAPFPVYVYTEKDRRELVRRVWEEALRAALCVDDPLKEACMKYFADWIKEQQL